MLGRCMIPWAAASKSAAAALLALLGLLLIIGIIAPAVGTPVPLVPAATPSKLSSTLQREMWQLSNAAYKTGEERDTTLPPGWSVAYTQVSEDGTSRGYVAVRRDDTGKVTAATAVFRGSNGPTDWANNGLDFLVANGAQAIKESLANRPLGAAVDLWKQPTDMSLRVTTDMTDESVTRVVLDELTKQCGEGCEKFFTGHSRGGGMAQAAAARFRQSDPTACINNAPTTVGFGAITGVLGYGQGLEPAMQALSQKSFNVIAQGDCVPGMMPGAKIFQEVSIRRRRETCDKTTRREIVDDASPEKLLIINGAKGAVYDGILLQSWGLDCYAYCENATSTSSPKSRAAAVCAACKALSSPPTSYEDFAMGLTSSDYSALVDARRSVVAGVVAAGAVGAAALCVAAHTSYEPRTLAAVEDSAIMQDLDIEMDDYDYSADLDLTVTVDDILEETATIEGTTGEELGADVASDGLSDGTTADTTVDEASGEVAADAEAIIDAAAEESIGDVPSEGATTETALDDTTADTTADDETVGEVAADAEATTDDVTVEEPIGDVSGEDATTETTVDGSIDDTLATVAEESLGDVTGGEDTTDVAIGDTISGDTLEDGTSDAAGGLDSSYDQVAGEGVYGGDTATSYDQATGDDIYGGGAVEDNYV